MLTYRVCFFSRCGCHQVLPFYVARGGVSGVSLLSQTSLHPILPMLLRLQLVVYLFFRCDNSSRMGVVYLVLFICWQTADSNTAMYTNERGEAENVVTIPQWAKGPFLSGSRDMWPLVPRADTTGAASGRFFVQSLSSCYCTLQKPQNESNTKCIVLTAGMQSYIG